MAKVRLLQGKPLMRGGKVALSDDCCCGPPAGHGACCIGLSCSIKTNAACIAAGGVYKGDGTPCGAQTCCPTIILTCDGISASKTKCQFDEFGGFESTPPKVYLTQIQVNRCNTVPAQECISTATYDPVTCISSGANCTNNASLGCDETCFPNVCPFTFCNPPVATSSTHAQCGGSLPSFETFRSIDLSDEYTTDQLILNTIAALPSYPGTFTDSCLASRDLSTNEKTYTISRFKPKFTIGAALGTGLTICYNEHLVPDSGSNTNIPRTVTITAGQTNVVGTEITEPDDDGQITVTNIRCC